MSDCNTGVGISSGALLALIAGTAVLTYLLRAIPMLLLRKPLRNPYLVALLEYLPYALLSAMIFPDIFYSTSEIERFPQMPSASAVAGTLVALVLAFFGLNLPLVAASATVVACICKYLFL